MNQLKLDAVETKSAINALEAAMLINHECSTNFDDYLTHYFAEGIYVREMRIPLGTLIVGKAHLMHEVCVLTKGVILVKAEGMLESKVYEAPYTFNVGPGKKVLYILEDTIFLNIHPNPSNTTDLSILEKELIAPDVPVLEVVS